MRKTAIIVVAALVVCVAISGWVLAILWRAEVNRVTADNLVYVDQIRALEEALRAAQTELVYKNAAVDRAKASVAQIEVEVRDLESARDVLADDISGLEGALADLGDERDGLRSKIADQRNTIWEFANEIAKLGKFASCKPDTRLEMDYADSTTASDSLREFLDEERGGVVDVRWQVAWQDARMVIHSVTSAVDETRVTDVFVVYMPGEEGHSGVYWLNETCFLELPG